MKKHVAEEGKKPREFCFVFVCCRIQTVKFERLDGLGILKSEENSIGYGNRAS